MPNLKRIRSKLVLLFLGFGLIPVFAIFTFFNLNEHLFKESFENHIKSASIQLNDMISRSLHERHADAQVFATNSAALDRTNWRNSDPENPLTKSMNSYMKSYGIYKLMLMVDLNGNVLASNSKDANGDNLYLEPLEGQNFANADWFKAVSFKAAVKRAAAARSKKAASEIASAGPDAHAEHTDPNEVVKDLEAGSHGHEGGHGSGALVLQPRTDEVVARIYREDGFTIPFVSTVKDARGKPIAVWVNFADFALVENIVAEFHKSFVREGMRTAELTVLGPTGVILVDYDPGGQIWTDYNRKFDVIGKLNLVEEGVDAAQRAINGESGYAISVHARKNIEQVAAYSHSQGFFNLSGLDWSVLIRVDTAEAFASVNLVHKFMLIVIVCSVLMIICLGWFIGDATSRPLRALSLAMNKLARGELESKVPGQRLADETGEMARAVNVFKQQAKRNVMLEAENKRQNIGLEDRIFELEKLKVEMEKTSDQAIETAESLSLSQGIQLDAIQNISEGFSLWDRDNKLIMCNENYKRAFSVSSDILFPGAAFEDFLTHCYEENVFVEPESEEDVAELVAHRLERHRRSTVSYEEKLADDRWILVNERAASDGRIVGIVSDITEQKNTEFSIQTLAETDALTGLPNRILFHQRLREALDNANEKKTDVGIMLLDLDHFKHVNDTLGHPIGDALLCEVSKRLLDCCRQSDTVARLGGDEFAIIATNLSVANKIDAIAQRIISALSAPFYLEDKTVLSGGSVGITVFPEDFGDTDHLLRNADIALYQAKEQGRGTFKMFDSKLNAEVAARRTIEEDLRTALESGNQLALFFQPQIELATGKLTGAEILLRWNHPTRGLIMPNDFIPVAEMTRLIVPLGENILDSACAQAKAWQDMGLEPITLAVNKSPLEFKHQDMVTGVKAALAQHQLDPQWLELEITEGAAMDKSSIRLMKELKDLGISMAIDDFGLGYSSLTRLKDFPINRLKIDKSFVQSIDSEADRRAICSTIIALGNNLKLQVVAEGVETTTELEIVRDMGCHHIQGYILSEPLSSLDFEKFQREHDAQKWMTTAQAIAS